MTLKKVSHCFSVQWKTFAFGGKNVAKQKTEIYLLFAFDFKFIEAAAEFVKWKLRREEKETNFSVFIEFLSTHRMLSEEEVREDVIKSLFSDFASHNQCCFRLNDMIFFLFFWSLRLWKIN